MSLSRLSFRILLTAIACSLIGAVSLRPSLAQEEPKTGGILRVAILGEPPSLDAHWTTATITRDVTSQMYETLFTLDENFAVTPMLAEDYVVEDDGRRWTIDLRQGVMFHNGKEMTSEDVVASLERWAERGASGGTLFSTVDSLNAIDDYTIEFELSEPLGILPSYLTEILQFGAIYPKEIVEAAGPNEQITEFIGTGPFKFEEHLPDRYIRMSRFEDYSAREEEPNGYGGRRVVYVDELRFMPVPDVAVRAAGLEAGDFDFAGDLSPDDFERLEGNPQVEPLVVQPYYWAGIIMNKKGPIFSDRNVREALRASLSVEPILAAGYGNPAFYRLSHSLHPEETVWYSEAGSDRWNNPDLELARQLLEESGYDGTPLRWITTQEYPWMYNISLAARSQLQAVGFEIDLQVMDWATVGSRRTDPGSYDVFVTGFPTFYHPATDIYLDENWPGWWESEERDQLLSEFVSEVDLARQQELWSEIQQVFWDEVPIYLLGDYFNLSGQRTNVRGYANLPDKFFWNVWLDR